jgi:SWI/SNF-related matrix-associated actin-dependent regulator of chromatin subfamily A3
MVEDQAVGRVLRLGQTKEVKVIRYIMKNTVEVVRQSSFENDFWSANASKGMRSQQRRKLDLAKLGWREDE